MENKPIESNPLYKTRPNLIKTGICPNCKRNTRNHYDNGTDWCGMCFTFSYTIKK